jgi:hypothetical protein
MKSVVESLGGIKKCCARDQEADKDLSNLGPFDAEQRPCEQTSMVLSVVLSHSH